ncbi:uncharacterized protein LOC114446581 [Parambassis ranga]|uniref:Uncharacterized protein LOC114446581 n=1 Tax=Parambassis ranga TaxID=210632 RepID=A0A6P7JRC4_9TELE|nr:uncharacterized protein LOC114446581 [Parambassis ranga]
MAKSDGLLFKSTSPMSPPPPLHCLQSLGGWCGVGQVRSERGERQAQPLFTAEAAHSLRSTGETQTKKLPCQKSLFPTPLGQDTSTKGAPAIHLSPCSKSDVEEEDGERCGDGGGLKWSAGGVSCQHKKSRVKPRTPHLLSTSSLVCTGCHTGDMAAGFSPDCRNISSVAESRTAGKDNESKGRGGRGRQGGQTMDFFYGLRSHMHTHFTNVT